MQTAQQFKLAHAQRLTVNYLLFLPSGYIGESTKRWPLILFLHGAGERGTDVWKVAAHGPPKQVADHPDLPFIIVSPQCPKDQIWSDDVLLALLNEVSGKYAVDANRVYLTGLSMGGYGTWSLGLACPEKFAAIVPICGGGEVIRLLLCKPDNPRALKTLGVWAFHGAKDPIVPLHESQRLVRALKKIGSRDVKLTVYPNAQHDSWTRTYQNPALYQWLLAHDRHTPKRRKATV